MQHALARQAEAERNRRAKVINAEGEYQAADRLAAGGRRDPPEPGHAPAALPAGAPGHQRQPGSTIVFPLPLDLLRPLLERGDARSRTRRQRPARTQRAGLAAHCREHASRGRRARRVDRVRARGPRARRPARSCTSPSSWQEPGGGGAVAAVQLAKLAGEATLYTALGDDEIGHRVEASSWSALGAARGGGLPARAAAARLRARGRRRRAHDHRDRQPARPAGRDPLPWDELAETDAVYFTAGDVGRRARRPRGRQLVVDRARAGDAGRGGRGARRAGRERAATRASATRPGELEPPPRWWCAPRARGRRATRPRDGRARPLEGDAPARTDQRPLRLRRQLRRGPDLRARRRPADRRRRSTCGARCGAACATGRGPYAGQLREGLSRSGHAAVGRLDRQPVLDPGLEAAGQVVGAEAGRARTPGRRAPSGCPSGSRRRPAARGRASPPRRCSRSSSMCTSPAIRPASCSYGSRTSTSCASPSRTQLGDLPRRELLGSSAMRPRLAEGQPQPGAPAPAAPRGARPAPPERY